MRDDLSGDGVEYAFRRDPSVMTISFHETPAVRWPGTGWIEERGDGPGRGSAVNMPFASYTADESWLECVREVFPRVVRSSGRKRWRSTPLCTVTTRSGSRS